jgi:epoxyqueuosine reductase
MAKTSLCQKRAAQNIPKVAALRHPLFALARPPRPAVVRRSHEQAVRDHAGELGFDAVGFARADVPLEREFDRYEAFLDAGLEGELAYLADNREVRRRLDGEGILPGARSVICVAARYARPDEAREAPPGSVASLIARYARGRDYHQGTRRRLQRLAAFVRGLAPGVEARPIIDTAPVLERAWAARAGLGFVGKNGIIIVPGKGSYVLLGEVVTTLELLPDEPMTERCGSCTRCLDACPTQAFPSPFVLDTRRCIAFLTIEREGPVPEPLREGVGDRLFGCDVCQDVCPFNRTQPGPPERSELFAPLERWRSMSPADLLSLGEEAWPSVSEGTPLRRPGAAGLLRNAITVIANQGRADLLPALRALAASHADAAVREHARWACGRLEEVPPDVSSG